MHEIRRTTTAAPDDVWAALKDGWLYPTWVVGASRMREVDDEWPAKAAQLHHSVGVWPLLIDDATTVLEAEPPARLVLKARGWPLGEARVELRIDAWAGGSMLTITEDAIAGPGSLVPKPLRQAMIGIRNRETLKRLIMVAEGRHGD